MQRYIASRISSEHNTLYPDMLEIDDYNVTYYKGYVLGYTTTVIPRHSIAGVSLDSGLFYADVVITSCGGTCIKARGFNKSKAREIMRILI